MASTTQDARDAAWDLIGILSRLPSGEIEAVLKEFATGLYNYLGGCDNTLGFARRVLEALAERAAYLAGLEVVDKPAPSFSSYDDLDMREQAEAWYALGHEDGEEGMAPVPQGHHEWESW